MTYGDRGYRHGWRHFRTDNPASVPFMPRAAPGAVRRRHGPKKIRVQSFFNSVAPINARLVTAVWQ